MKASAGHRAGTGFLLVVLSGSLLGQVPVPSQADGGLQPGASAAPVANPQAPSDSKPHDNSFIIGNDDVLSISVWKETDLSRSIPVRSDGKISLPLIGELQAAGLTPLQLEKDIAGKLKGFMTDPEVTVMVQQINSEKFNILGQVARPGSYSLALAKTVVDATS